MAIGQTTNSKAIYEEVNELQSEFAAFHEYGHIVHPNDVTEELVNISNELKRTVVKARELTSKLHSIQQDAFSF